MLISCAELRHLLRLRMPRESNGGPHQLEWMHDKLVDSGSVVGNCHQNQDATVFVLDCSWLHLPCFAGREAREEFDLVRLPGAYFFDIDEACDHSSPLPHMLPTDVEFDDYLGRLLAQNHQRPSCIRRLVDEFVLYDSLGFWSAPRVYWMFKKFGFERVRVLDGGLMAWWHAGLPVERGSNRSACVMHDPILIVPPLSSAKQAAGHDYSASVWSLKQVDALVEWYAENFSDSSMQELRSCCSAAWVDSRDSFAPGAAPARRMSHWQSSYCIVDARPRDRFLGLAPEPRPNLPSGHIPGSINIPWFEVLDSVQTQRPQNTLSTQKNAEPERLVGTVPYVYYHLKSKPNLRRVFDAALGSRLSPLSREPDQVSQQPCTEPRSTRTAPTEKRVTLVFSCGSGISAAILYCAAAHASLLPLSNLKIFDGSWTQWKLHDLTQQQQLQQEVST